MITRLIAADAVQICLMVMRQRLLKHIYTQQALLAVLPRLAAFNPTIFSTKSVPYSDF